MPKSSFLKLEDVVDDDDDDDDDVDDETLVK